MLIEELKIQSSLGAVHSNDPIRAERGFAEHGTYCNMFHQGPHRPKQPLGLSSAALKDPEKRYTLTEKRDYYL